MPTILINCPTGQDCKKTKAGFKYAGPRIRTSLGLACQPWADNKPNINAYIDSTAFPDGSAKAAGNKCRNPTAGSKHPNLEGPWCYTMSTDRNNAWGFCDVPLCGMFYNNHRKYLSIHFLMTRRNYFFLHFINLINNVKIYL